MSDIDKMVERVNKLIILDDQPLLKLGHEVVMRDMGLTQLPKEEDPQYDVYWSRRAELMTVVLCRVIEGLTPFTKEGM